MAEVVKLGRRIAMWGGTLFPLVAFVCAAIDWPKNAFTLFTNSWGGILCTSAVLYSPNFLETLALRFGDRNAVTIKEKELSEDPYAPTTDGTP